MKKALIFLMMALLLLPVAGLAEDAPPAETPQAGAPAAPTSRGCGWRRGAPQGAPGSRFTDENNDGVCDACGQTPAQDDAAPGFADEDGDGVCDHRAAGRRQGRGMGRMRGPMQGMRGRMQGRGMGRTGQRGQGVRQGRNFVDANGDGVCDNLNDNAVRGVRPCRCGR